MARTSLNLKAALGGRIYVAGAQPAAAASRCSTTTNNNQTTTNNNQQQPTTTNNNQQHPATTSMHQQQPTTANKTATNKNQRARTHARGHARTNAAHARFWDVFVRAFHLACLVGLLLLVKCLFVELPTFLLSLAAIVVKVGVFVVLLSLFFEDSILLSQSGSIFLSCFMSRFEVV